MSKTKRVFECNNDPDNFCYVCGKYIIKRYQRKFTDLIKNKYLQYFGMPVENLDNRWTPNCLCSSCHVTLSTWPSKRYMTFGPMIWREPLCHANDCYFCLSKQSGFGKSMRWNYAHTQSVTFPVPHSNAVPYPELPEKSSDSSSQGKSDESEFDTERVWYRLSQAQLNDWVRDLELSKDKAELLASRMKQSNFLAPGVKISYYRTRHEPYAKYFTMEDKICYCNDTRGLFNELGQSHDSAEWRLFIDSSKESLKAVFLHNGNEKPSIHIAHAVNTNESYETIAKLLKCIKYEKYDWKICCDLKVVGMLRGLQSGYTKYCCFLCLWDSRAGEEHDIKKGWPKRENIAVGCHNVKYEPLVKMENIILPPLHIKLGLIKNFIKALNKEGQAFAHLKTLFSNLSLAKIKEGVLDGPQIKKLLKDDKFEKYLTHNEATAWKSFQLIVSDFLGNYRSPNYVKIVDDLLENYAKIGVNMSLKIHFLHSYLDFFPENLGKVSDEHGERFHQQLKAIERRYQGFWDEGMMGDFIWFLIRESDPKMNKRQRRSRNYF